MRKTIQCLGLILTGVLLFSCENKKPVEAKAPVRVKTMTVATADLSAAQVYSGTVEENTSTTLSFPVSGTLNRIYVNSGDFVRSGQLIAELDQATLENAYRISQATLNQAQDAYNRLEQLHNANSVSEMQWVEIQNTLQQAQNAEEIARRALGDAKLYAPFSGYITLKLADAGMTVAPAEPIVKLVTINPVKVSISIPENEISAVPSRGAATVTVSALGGETFTGDIVQRGVSANPLSRAYDVKIQLDNPENRLLPGMICDVTLASNNLPGVIVLPYQSVLLDADNQNFVWLKKDGRATKRIVGVEGMADTGIIISSGIAPGDSVIVEGQQKVSESTKVVSINN